ncbi:MAG: LicD family protein [Bacteroidales bacterium]|nr:LicD family protein [Bacteroidales bacterium]
MKSQYKSILIATLKAFAELCDREGLRWYMAFGSAIGAVRHGGIIPWDDDIDVYMPREDFQRMLTLQNPEGYEILHLSRSSQPLPYTYAKFCDASSTIWEQRKYPCLIGVFIDIFPLDQVSAGIATPMRKIYAKTLVAYKRGIRRTTFGQWWHGTIHDKLAAVQDLLYYRPMRRRNKDFLMKVDEDVTCLGGDNYILYDNIYGDSKVVYDKSLFEGEPLMANFEGMKVPLPSGNDTLLTQIYGDYMTPPPEDKRVSGHHHYFMDLDRRLTMADIKELQK